jgi:protein transport protein SEC23
MKSLPGSTNGVIVLSDSFATSIFKQSFLRLFNKDDQGHLQMGFNATFDVQVRFHQPNSSSPQLIMF